MPILNVDKRETRDMLFGVVDDIDCLFRDLEESRARVAELESALADAEEKIEELEQQVEDLINNG